MLADLAARPMEGAAYGVNSVAMIDATGALESVTGQKVILAELSHSLLLNTKVTMGGEKIPARELLKQAFASTKQPLQYDLGFNPDMPAYILSTSLAMREEDDGLGGKRLVPIDRRP